MASLPYPRSLLTAIFSHRFHRSAQNLLTAIFFHRFHRSAQNLLAVISSHRIHRSAQKLLVEKGLPQIARIYTDVGGYGILPYLRNH